MTLADIIEECEASGVFAGFHVPSHKKPIVDKSGACVGFYATRNRDGIVCMGFVYIATPYRRQGHALKAAKEFFRYNPKATWYALNPASEALAQKIGLTYQTTHSSGIPIYAVP